MARTKYVIVMEDKFGISYFKNGGFSSAKSLNKCQGFYKKEKALKELKEAKQCCKEFEIVELNGNR